MDKVTVEEPLISTDVDNLIRTIAEKKKIGLNDLRQECKIDKKTMDKWIAVLEDEGYINVEYGIRGTYIFWRENGQIERAEQPQGSFEETPVAPVMEEIQEPNQEEIPQEVHGDFSPTKTEEEPEPEELLSDYLERKRGNDVESLKSNILTSLDESESSSWENDTFDTPEEKPETELPPRIKVKQPIVKDIVKETEAPRQIGVITPPKRASADVRELVASYLAEIKNEKAKTEALRKEKENLYRDKFNAIEGKMQADIVVITEKILEKQSKIAELKERVLELPDKVDQLSEVQKQMEDLKKEGKDALERTRQKAEQFIGSLSTSKTEIEQKLSTINSTLAEQSERMKELEKTAAVIGARSAKAKSALEDTRVQVEELNSTLSNLTSDLEALKEMKQEVAEMTDSVKEAVASHGSELESLEEEIEGISRVEHWVEEYIRDYEQKVSEIEEYVSHGEDEISDLRESAESLYMKKYLGELENLADAYENELQDTVSSERSIEGKITASRTRISELVGESHDMIKKLRSDLADERDYDEILSRVKERTAKTKSIVGEKQKERSKLREDSKKTRKTKSVGLSKKKKKK